MQKRTIVLGFFLTLVIYRSHGQCSFLDGKLDAGHSFKKNVGHGLYPKEALKNNDLISLLKIDSIGLTNSSWFAAIQFHDRPTGQVEVTFEFQNKKIVRIRGQQPRLSELDTMYFDENELVFPIDAPDVELILSIEIVSIQITTEQKLVTFSPEKNLLKRMTKCLM